MGGNSVSGDEDEVRFPPEAVKPFWVEVGVHLIGFGLTALALQLGFRGLLAVFPAAAMIATPAGLFGALALPTVFRGLVRPGLRRRAGLGPDSLSWWYKSAGVSGAHTHVREISPVWHIDRDRLHWPIFGHIVAARVGMVLSPMVNIGLWLDQFDPRPWFTPGALIFTIPALIFLAVFCVADPMARARLER